MGTVTSKPGAGTFSLLGIAILSVLGTAIFLGFIGLGGAGITWVYTQGPFWAKFALTGFLLVFIGAVVSFVRYISTAPYPTHDDTP